MTVAIVPVVDANPGDEIEVCNTENGWSGIKRKFITMLNGWVMCESRSTPGMPCRWKYGRKIEPKYRTPVMPDDYGKECEFKNEHELTWSVGVLCGYRSLPSHEEWIGLKGEWDHARIKMDHREFLILD